MTPPGGRRNVSILALTLGEILGATPSAGWFYDRYGWVTLNLAVVPLLCVALLATIGIERRLRVAAMPV